ncbi:ABC transporter ATP-binding protein/permease [Marinospirillum sp. MEB164]|uniref:ABC transporter ATP-binding protein/permease n=1 Tax=Marinospirillum alkalitolerans TaxID=3123374 RepID=A0ABW8PZB1_9GAMM
MQVLQDFWRLTRAYWLRRQAWPQLLLLLVVLGMSLSSVWFSVQINHWNGDFFNALQALDGEAIYPLLLQFVGLVAAFVLVMVYADYLKKKLMLEWRQWMTDDYATRWLSPTHHHYQLQLTQQEPDNPDQRIAEDIRILVEDSLNLLVSFLRSVLTLFSFLAILWQFSTPVDLSWMGLNWVLPGYLVWVCLAYTLVGTWITHRIGRELQPLNYQQQRCEADLRHLLMQQREYSEAIAGQQGENCERQRLRTGFQQVAGNWYRLMRREKNLSFFTQSYAQVTSLAPIFFALPAFLAGSLLLGGLMQVRLAFAQVAGALSWFIYAYRDLASWSATVARLTRFQQRMASLETEAQWQPATGMRMQISVKQADQSPLLEMPPCRLEAGDFMLIEGASGLGKSSLLRTLAGHWAHFSGEIKRDPHLLWVPQDLYLPRVSLKSLLCYPQPVTAQTDAACLEALEQVGLASLAQDLHQEQEWRLRLSGGEQQRVMWARVLLNRPAIALMDETTSALDTASALALIHQVRRACPELILVLVSHQAAHAEEVTQRLSFQAGTPAQGVFKEQKV